MPDAVTSVQRQRLIARLKEQERSRAWLARRLGMNESQFSHTLAGRRRVPIDFWRRVAEILDVSLSDLLSERPAA